MIDQINAILKEQSRLFPDQPEFRAWVNQSDLWNWTYTAFRIKGEPIKRSVVVDMLEGKIREDVTLSSYAFAQAVQNVYKDMKNYIQMQTALSPEMIIRWAKMLLGVPLSGDDSLIIRSDDKLVYEWELVSCKPEKIDETMRSIVWEYNHDRENNAIARATKLHLELDRLYAFGEETSLVSMAVLMFTLLEHGFSIPELPLSDREYNTLIAGYIADDDMADFYSMMCRSIYNRHQQIVDYCKQARDVDEWTKF